MTYTMKYLNVMGTSPIEASFASSVFRVIWNPSTASNYSQFFFNELIRFLQIVAFGSPP